MPCRCAGLRSVQASHVDAMQHRKHAGARLKAVGPAEAGLAGVAGLAERRAVVVAGDHLVRTRGWAVVILNVNDHYMHVMTLAHG